VRCITCSRTVKSRETIAMISKFQ